MEPHLPVTYVTFISQGHAKKNMQLGAQPDPVVEVL
jgi:hypothetical protein